MNDGLAGTYVNQRIFPVKPAQVEKLAGAHAMLALYQRTLMPGSYVCRTKAPFSVSDHRLRRCSVTETTSIVCLSFVLVIITVVCLCVNVTH